MPKSKSLLGEAREGFAAEPPFANPYLASSDAHAAWAIGRWFRTNRGAFYPIGEVRAARGQAYIGDDLRFRIESDGTAKLIGRA